MEKQKKDKKDKKKNREEERKKALEAAQKEIEDLIANMNNMIGNEENPIKMLEIKIPTKKEKIMSFICSFVLSLLILLSLSGFINWLYYDNILMLLSFVGIIVVSESLLNWIIMYFFGKYILYSFGMIKILAPIFAFVIGILIFPFVEVKNFVLMLIVFVLYNVIKRFMMGVIQKELFGKINKVNRGK